MADEIFGMPIINDENAPDPVDVVIAGHSYGRGYRERDYTAEPEGRRLGMADDEKIIDPSEYDARYEEAEATKSSLKHVNEFFQVPPKDQNGTSDCWINAPVGMMELVFVSQGLDPVQLAPGWIASRLGEYSGGMGMWSMTELQKVGCPETKVWGGANRHHEMTDTAAVLASAERFRVAQFRDLPRRNMHHVFHHLFLNRPVCVGLNWWGHEVYYLAPIRIERGRWGVVAKNSWGPGYGKNGVFVLEASKMVPDDAQVLYRVTPYGKEIGHASDR